MNKLKLTSIRVSTEALDCAHALCKQLGYYNPSDVLRLAMWVGFKVLTPQNAGRLMQVSWAEEAEVDIYTLEDVLRTAGVIKDECKG